MFLAKKALNGLIETQDILFYLPQAKTFVNEDNFNKWSENLSKCNLDKFVIYCKKRINGNKNESFFIGQ